MIWGKQCVFPKFCTFFLVLACCRHRSRYTARYTFAQFFKERVYVKVCVGCKFQCTYQRNVLICTSNTPVFFTIYPLHCEILKVFSKSIWVNDLAKYLVDRLWWLGQVKFPLKRFVLKKNKYNIIICLHIFWSNIHNNIDWTIISRIVKFLSESSLFQLLLYRSIVERLSLQSFWLYKTLRQ